MIAGFVRGQELRLSVPRIAADTINYLTAKFMFQSAEWDGLEKWSHWQKGTDVYDIPLTDDQITEDAHLNLSAGKWTVYLHGNKFADGEVVQRITTEQKEVVVLPTGSLSGEPFPEIPASETERILARLGVLETAKVLPDAKTDAMTQPVGRDADGKLWTAPSGGGGSYVVTLTKGDSFYVADHTAAEAHEAHLAGKSVVYELIDDSNHVAVPLVSSSEEGCLGYVRICVFLSEEESAEQGGIPGITQMYTVQHTGDRASVEGKMLIGDKETLIFNIEVDETGACTADMSGIALLLHLMFGGGSAEAWVSLSDSGALILPMTMFMGDTVIFSAAHPTEENVEAVLAMAADETGTCEFVLRERKTVTGATDAAAGAKGLVPAPKAGEQNAVLHGDGTWRDVVIPEKTSELTNDSGFITRLVADLANYYTKSQTYTQAEVNALVSAIPKFAISVVSSLPASGISATTVYLVKSGTDSDLYTEYIYVNGAWEILGSQRVDLTGYATETWVNTKLADYLPAAQLQTAISDALAQAKASGEFDGADGTSPTVSVAAITRGHRITITDKDGTKTVDVMDGEDGDPGSNGRGIVSVARTSGTGAAGTTDTYTITYTDNTTSTFAVYNGKDGAKGEKGDTYTLTAADKNEIAALSPGRVVVTITQNDDGTYSTSHTSQEIYALVQARNTVVALFEPDAAELQLSSAFEESVAFAQTVYAISPGVISRAVLIMGNEVRYMYSDVLPMYGATSGADGRGGTVPAPTAGQQNHILYGSGTWGAKPSYSKSEVGLGNVDNVKQYSADNPPPYPVTSVNGKTGAVTVAEDVWVQLTLHPDKTFTSSHTSQEIVEAITAGKTVGADALGLRMTVSKYNPDGSYVMFAGVITQDGKGIFGSFEVAGSTVTFTEIPVGTMTGATIDADGKGGLVPAPAAGEQNRVLHSDGTWRQPSWETLADRPFGEERFVGEILPPTTIDLTEYGGAAFLPDALGLAEGELYTVTWNGTVYECTASYDSDMNAMVLYDESMPFGIVEVSETDAQIYGGRVVIEVIEQEYPAEVVLGITGVTETIQKLDPKFYNSVTSTIYYIDETAEHSYIYKDLALTEKVDFMTYLSMRRHGAVALMDKWRNVYTIIADVEDIYDYDGGGLVYYKIVYYVGKATDTGVELTTNFAYTSEYGSK